MLGLVTTMDEKAPVELRELPEPRPQRLELRIADDAALTQRLQLAQPRLLGRRRHGRGDRLASPAAALAPGEIAAKRVRASRDRLHSHHPAEQGHGRDPSAPPPEGRAVTRSG